MTEDTAPIHLGITDVGDGVPIVFSHGWLDDRHAWDGVTENLCSDFRCVSWDLRGHGESDAPPPGEYSRSHALEDLDRVIGSLPRPVVLAGHSLGGYLSLAYTILNPASVQGLILVAAGPGFRKPESREQWNESVSAAAATSDIPAGSEEISKHVDSWVIDNLGEISCPTLVIVGEHDKRFMASAAVFEKQLDVRSTHIVPDAGHRVHSKKAVQVADHMRDFLEQI